MIKQYIQSIIAAGMIVVISSHAYAQAVTTGFVNVNNVNAGFGSSGNFFTSFADTASKFNGFHLYEAPQGTGMGAIFTSALWMGGYDAGSNLHLAANRYFDIGKDYYPGPVGDTANALVKYCKNVFAINRTTITQFLTLSFPTTWNMIDSSILEWPALGNTYLDTFQNIQITSSLAPFVDVDGDGIYNPLKGDYPDFCGDDAVFFVYNDSAGPHGESGGAILGVEVRCLAFEFNQPVVGGLPDTKIALNNTVFLEMNVQNMSANNYSNYRLGLFEDPDVGCALNDRVGCDTTRNLMFAYNGTSPDDTCLGEVGYTPYQVAHGVVMLSQNMSDFVYFTNGAIAAKTDPYTALQYENYLTGHWDDGTPFTYGGTAYGGLQPTNFCFPGDPNDTTQWSEIQVTNSLPPGDRRLMGSIGPMAFNAGQIIRFDFAYTTSYDSTGTMLGMVDTLKRDADIVQDFYNSDVLPCRNRFQLIAAINNISNADNMELLVYPNPANTQINIQSGAVIQALSLTDVEGRIVAQQVNIPGKYTLNISNLAKGVYMLKVINQGKTGIKKVVIN